MVGLLAAHAPQPARLLQSDLMEMAVGEHGGAEGPRVGSLPAELAARDDVVPAGHAARGEPIGMHD